MSNQLVNFKGLYGDNQSVFQSNFIHHELLEIRSKVFNWEIKEHLHTDLFQVFFIDEGEGFIIIDGKKHKIEHQSIILIPSNTVHGFVFQPNIKGDVITFSESFLDTIFKNSPRVMMEISKFCQLNFTNKLVVLEQIMQHKNQILRELVEENPEKKTVIQLLFQLLFIEIYRFSMAQNNDIFFTDNRTLGYFQAFQKSAKQTIREKKSIGEYAKELNITTVHLNRICQALVQKSALQIVHEYLINEAKKYLLNTNYSVSEVSYFLNFSDPAYFTRLFKKQTGVSPSEFRKS
jgi:AraC family transcriptional regulator, transcriptional activator of pobA